MHILYTQEARIKVCLTTLPFIERHISVCVSTVRRGASCTVAHPVPWITFLLLDKHTDLHIHGVQKWRDWARLFHRFPSKIHEYYILAIFQIYSNAYAHVSVCQQPSNLSIIYIIETHENRIDSMYNYYLNTSWAG